MRPAELRAALRRFARQERDDGFAARMLPRVVFGLAGLCTLVVFASSSGAAFVATCVLIVLAAVGWWLRTRPELALALVSSVVTVFGTGIVTGRLDMVRGVPQSAAGAQAVFGFWALSGMALLGAWMLKRHSGNRGVTVLISDVLLMAAAFSGALLPGFAVTLGFVAVLLVLALRGGVGRGAVILATAAGRRRLDGFEGRRAERPRGAR